MLRQTSCKYICFGNNCNLIFQSIKIWLMTISPNLLQEYKPTILIKLCVLKKVKISWRAYHKLLQSNNWFYDLNKMNYCIKNSKENFDLKARIVLLSCSDSSAFEGRHNMISRWWKHESFAQVLELAKYFGNRTDSSFRWTIFAYVRPNIRRIKILEAPYKTILWH